jgi:RecA/RadA recombinase
MARASRQIAPVEASKAVSRPLRGQIEARAKKAPEVEDTKLTPDNFASSGSTLLNLALTGHPDFGWQFGRMANIIGDSGVGKTLLVLTSCAETAYNDAQNEVELDFDDAEHAMGFDVGKIFGSKTEARLNFINPPSENIEQFSDNLALRMRKKIPFIYVLDSFDAIGSEADTEHIESERKIRLGESNKKSTGSYGMAKPKLASQMLREDCGTLEKTKGALLIISQTRDNLTPGSFEKKTRSGGKALKFYANHEVWVILTSQIKKGPKGRERRVGAEAQVKVTKNKVTGKRRTVNFDIYDGYGIDDINSMIDFMLDEKEWTGGGSSKINTKRDLGIPEVIGKEGGIMRDALIDLIEADKKKLRELKDVVTELWNDIEKSLEPKRVSKYA